jgi:hypothetical protein
VKELPWKRPHDFCQIGEFNKRCCKGFLMNGLEGFDICVESLQLGEELEWFEAQPHHAGGGEADIGSRPK